MRTQSMRTQSLKKQSMTKRSGVLKTLRLAFGLGLALSAAGCESLEALNPFEQHKKPVPGTRTPVFPQGVPGVDYSTPLSQPSNANAPIDQLPPPQQSGQPQQR